MSKLGVDDQFIAVEQLHTMAACAVGHKSGLAQGSSLPDVVCIGQRQGTQLGPIGCELSLSQAIAWSMIIPSPGRSCLHD